MTRYELGTGRGRPTGQGGGRVPALRIAGHVALTALVIAALVTIVGLLAAFATRPTGSVTSFAVLQSILGLLAVVLAMRWRTAAGLRAGVPAVPWSLAAGLGGYVLLPTAWTGSALVSWQLVGAGPVSWLLDLLVWVVVVAVGVLWGDSTEQRRERPLTPYG